MPGKLFQPSLMFAGKAGAYLSEEVLHSWIGSGLSCKRLNRLEKLVTEKRSSLLEKFITYGRKTFSNIGPWSQCFKSFFVCNLQIFVISLSVFP